MTPDEAMQAIENVLEGWQQGFMHDKEALRTIVGISYEWKY